MGDVILKVDGEDVKDRMTRMRKYVAASTPQSLRRDLAYLILAGPKGSNTTLTLRGRKDQEKQVELPRNCWSSYYLWVAGGRSDEIFRLVTQKIGYADLTRLDVSMVDGMFEKFKDTQAIIFDMRGYPRDPIVSLYLAGGNRQINAIVEQPVVMFPDTPSFQWSKQWVTQTSLDSLTSLRGKESKYKGKTVMLIDERAQSSSEGLGLHLEVTNGTKFVGSPTAGANGGMTSFSVPGGIQIYFSGEAVRHADGRQLQRVGLVPDIEVKPTIAGIRAGRDEVLDKAVEYLHREIATGAKQ